MDDGFPSLWTVVFWNMVIIGGVALLFIIGAIIGAICSKGQESPDDKKKRKRQSARDTVSRSSFITIFRL